MFARAVLLGTIALTWVAPLHYQQPSRPNYENAVPLGDLQSTDWQKRANAYRAIESDPKALHRREVKSALIDLLDRENSLRHRTLTDSNGRIGVDDKYGEEYTEYVSALAGTVEDIVDWKSQQQLCTLAHSVYEPDSAFATKLATSGGATAVPCLLKMAQRGVFDRHDSIPLLVEIYGRSDLTAAMRRQARQVITSGLRDPSALVRQPTVQALGKFGTPEWIPALQNIAKHDPVSRRLDDGQVRFDIREAATKAIQSIQDRAKAQ